VLRDIDCTLLLSGPMHLRVLRHALATERIEVPDEFHYEIVGRAAKVVDERCSAFISPALSSFQILVPSCPIWRVFQDDPLGRQNVPDAI
jgi:hypothetical protein